MKIVFLVHYFPPLNSAGARRILGFSRFLHEAGHEVAVVTTAKRLLTAIDNEPMPPHVHVVSLGRSGEPVGGPAASVTQAAPSRRGWLEALRGFKRWLTRFLGQLPDSRLPFALRFVHPAFHRDAVPVLQRADVVISSSPPWPMHLAGWLVSRRYRRTWLLDYRDAFSQNHIVRGSAFSRWIEDRLDALFCRHADGVSSVSDPITEHYARSFGVAARTITNGYNPDLFDADGSGGPVPPQGHLAAPFVLRYLGTIYKPENIPLGLFDALRERHARRADARLVRVEFIGDCAPVARLVQERYPELQDRVIVSPKVAYGESLRLMKSSDALLFIETSSNGSDTAAGILTTKLFEYMACARPVLAVVDPDTLMARTLLRSGLCDGASTDALRVEASLDALISTDRRPVPDLAFIQSFSQRSTTQRLVEWLQALTHQPR